MLNIYNIKEGKENRLKQERKDKKNARTLYLKSKVLWLDFDRSLQSIYSQSKTKVISKLETRTSRP